MGDLRAGIAWDNGSIRSVDVAPDKKTWVAATQVPLTVIVGLNDTSELPPYPGQKGMAGLLTFAQKTLQEPAPAPTGTPLPGTLDRN
jgi:hypothetical protein